MAVNNQFRKLCWLQLSLSRIFGSAIFANFFQTETYCFLINFSTTESKLCNGRTKRNYNEFRKVQFNSIISSWEILWNHYNAQKAAIFGPRNSQSRIYCTAKRIIYVIDWPFKIKCWIMSGYYLCYLFYYIRKPFFFIMRKQKLRTRKLGLKLIIYRLAYATHNNAHVLIYVFWCWNYPAVNLYVHH